MSFSYVFIDMKVILEENTVKKAFAQIFRWMLSASECLHFFSLSAQQCDSQFRKPWRRVTEIIYTQHFVKCQELRNTQSIILHVVKHYETYRILLLFKFLYLRYYVCFPREI